MFHDIQNDDDELYEQIPLSVCGYGAQHMCAAGPFLIIRAHCRPIAPKGILSFKRKGREKGNKTAHPRALTSAWTLW
jgi:hypothetical protein